MVTLSSSSSSRTNTRPLLIFATYLLTNTLLTILIARSIVTSYHHNRLTSSRSGKSKPNSKAVSRGPRGTSIVIHTILTFFSLGVTWYYMLSFFTLSYQSWAHTHNIPLPNSIYTIDLLSLHGLASWFRQVKLGPWLKDVQLFREAWETVLETPGRTCWSSPIFVVTSLWSYFIAQEAQKRNIKHAWAYMTLGQLVAISFAMNLFYLAVLVHPLPKEFIDENVMQSLTTTQKDDETKQNSSAKLWTPPHNFYSALRSLVLISIFGLTTEAGHGHPRFLYWLAAPHVLLLLPPILHLVVPQRYRIVHDTMAEYDDFHAFHYTKTAALGIAVWCVPLYDALRSGQSGTQHVHRHSNVHHYPWQGSINKEMAIQSVWRSLLDHPAVSSVGWDSLLCTISFTAWKLTSP